MLEWPHDIVLASAGGKGTAEMVRWARALPVSRSLSHDRSGRQHLTCAAATASVATRGTARASSMPVAFLEASAEAIPLDQHSVDTVVTTWTLCSIPQAAAALADMRRVMRPGGKLLFIEHGLAPDEGVRRWQDWLTPAWRRISGGCHLNRPIRSMIEGTGFRIDRIETGYMPGPKPMTFMYEGSAWRK
jgi:SAM-dependent methyltransferase